MKTVQRKLLPLLLLFCVIFSFFPQKVNAEENEDFDVKVEVGFNDNYKIGFSTPVNITIKNNYKDINGEVEIRVPSSPGKYMSYVKPISLQKDAEKAVTINIPISMNRTKHVLVIYNGKEKVYEEKISTVAANNITTFIGILSDDFDSLSYINKAPSSSGMSRLSKTIKLDEKNFPEDIFTLNSFDIIVINDYDTSKLSKMQYDILKQWVNNGGTLLLGTGSKYNKTLSVFKDDFITGSQGTVQEISTSKIYELATNGDSKNEVRIDVASISINDSNMLIQDKGVKLVQSLKKGKGAVGILAFDLAQAPFAGWNNNTAFAEKLLGIVNPELTALKNNYDMQNNRYWLRNAMNQFSEMATAKTTSFYIILFIYILVVAPVSYFILKKIDKRELMWVTVPVFAVIFALVVYISGSGTRLSEITTNMISYLNIDEKGNASTETYTGIFNTNKMKVNISGQNGQKLLPLYDIDYYNPNQTIDKEVMEAKISVDGSVEYRNSSLLETKVVQVQQSTKNIGRIETNLNIKNGRITGEIKNSTTLDLVDCVILMPEGYYKIDTLKQGETVKLDSKVVSSYGGDIYQMIHTVYLQYSYNRSGTNMTEQERISYMDKALEGNILQMLFNKGNRLTEGLTFIGFSKTAIHDPLVVNGNQVKKNERNVVYMKLNPVFINGDTIEYPLGFVPYNVINTSSLNYDTYNHRFYGNGFAEIEYNIDQKMVVDEITVRMQSRVGISHSIYNYELEKYDTLDTRTINGDNLKKYLSADNILKIKLELKDADSELLMISAKGKVK